jgi:type 1 glutamine amidotransferase
MRPMQTQTGRQRNMRKSMTLAGMLAALFWSATAAVAQMVAPNPLSPLKNKKVMVLEGGTQGSHGPARDATWANLQAMAKEVGFSIVKGDPKNLTDASLAPYDILVFNFFFETQLETAFPQKSKDAFIAWLKKGNKGYVGYHTSGANEYLKNEWTWYQQNVTSMYYALHGSDIPQGDVTKTTDAAILSQPIMQGLPATFSAIDEWYEYDKTSPLFTECKIMYYLSNAQAINRAPFPIHPVAWYREDAAHTRYFYSTFAHNLDAVNTTWFKGIILRALEYVSGDPSTPILKAEGAPVATLKQAAYATASRELTVDLQGEYRVSVFSSKGQLLFRTKGDGKRTFTPRAFAKAGIYLIKVESKLTEVSQRMMIY